MTRRGLFFLLTLLNLVGYVLTDDIAFNVNAWGSLIIACLYDVEDRLR